VRIQFAATPLAGVVSGVVSGTERRRREALLEAVIADVAAALRPYVGGGGLTVPQECRVLLARR
jgi:hypothetical protein